MSGNVWEWTISDNPREKGVLRGGAWNLSAGLGQCRARAGAKMKFRGGEVGVRCCAGPEQAQKLRYRK